MLVIAVKKKRKNLLTIAVQKKTMLLEHKKIFMEIPGQLMVIPVKKTCSRRERDLVNLVDYAARVASELLTIAVKLLIIAVQRKNAPRA